MGSLLFLSMPDHRYHLALASMVPIDVNHPIICQRSSSSRRLAVTRYGKSYLLDSSMALLDLSDPDDTFQPLFCFVSTIGIVQLSGFMSTGKRVCTRANDFIYLMSDVLSLDEDIYCGRGNGNLHQP